MYGVVQIGIGTPGIAFSTIPVGVGVDVRTSVCLAAFLEESHDSIMTIKTISVGNAETIVETIDSYLLFIYKYVF
jgi:hypothetical protein